MHDIQDIMFAMEEEWNELENEAKQDFQSLRDEIKNKVMYYLTSKQQLLKDMLSSFLHACIYTKLKRSVSRNLGAPSLHLFNYFSLKRSLPECFIYTIQSMVNVFSVFLINISFFSIFIH